MHKDNNLENMKKNFSIFDPKAYLASKRGALQGAAAGKAAEREYPSRCSASGKYETNGEYHDSFTDLEKALMVARAVRQRGIDITSGYHDWVRIGYALARSLGEGGRGIYHDVSSLYPGYRREQCDRQYDSCLRGSSAAGGEVQLGTFFEIARRTAGVSVADVMREERMKMKNSGNVCPECSNVPASQNNCHNHSNYIYNINNKEVTNKDMDSVINKETLTQTNIPNKSSETASSEAYIFSSKINKAHLPLELQRIYELYTDDVKRDIILLATLNVASGLLGSCNGTDITDGGIFGIYANQNVAAPFYLMIYGSQGTGKGEVSVCRQIIRPLQNKLNSQYHNEMQAYEMAMDSYELSRKDRKSAAENPARKPRHPVCIRPVLEGNGTAASLYDTLNANGGWGMMFESEADTMTQMINTDFGNYSALLRAAYHHETASMGRATDKLHICIDAPRLSVLVTCTPGQILPFLGTFEDGLASRFLYYGLPGRKPVFEDPFIRTTKPLDKEFQKMGEALAKLLETLRKRGGKPLEFVMTQDMEKQFCDMFRDALEDDTMMLGDDYQGFIYRQGLICFRIAMVLTAFRLLDNKTDEKLGILDTQQSLVCDTRDFNTAKTIAEVMARHTAKVYATLAEETTNKFASKPLTDEEARFYNLLPDEMFEMADAVDIVKKVFKGSRSTANRLISKFRDKYSIIVRLKQGHYIKAELYEKEKLAENDGSASGNNQNTNPKTLI